MALSVDPTVPVTPNKLFPLMAYGYTGPSGSDWGDYANAFLVSILDQNLGGRFNPNVGGNTDYTVSSANAQNLYHSLSGALTGNINYILPNAGGIYLIFNGTTGNQSVTAKPLGGTGAKLPQGRTAIVFVNPDVALASVFVQGSGIAPYASNPYAGGTLTLTNSFGYLELALTSNATINPPSNPYDGQEYYIKDMTGACGTYTATFTGLLDGSSSRAIQVGYGWFRIRYSATANGGVGAWGQT